MSLLRGRLYCSYVLKAHVWFRISQLTPQQNAQLQDKLVAEMGLTGHFQNIPSLLGCHGR